MRLQRANVGLVVLIGHGLQIAVVTLAIGAFFVAFGTIAIDVDVTRAWLGHEGHALFDATVLDVPLRPTTELLRVSGAIAALSGLYYAISVLTDDRYREEFLDEITGSCARRSPRGRSTWRCAPLGRRRSASRPLRASRGGERLRVRRAD